MAVTFGTNDSPCTSSTDVFNLDGEQQPEALALKVRCLNSQEVTNFSLSPDSLKKKTCRQLCFYFSLQVYELLYGLGSTDIATDFGREKERKKKILDSSIPVADGRWRGDHIF
jgi:hypothetical protein